MSNRFYGAMLAIAMLAATAAPAKAGQLSANCSWNCSWAPSSPSDQAFFNSQALLDWQLRNGIGNPGGSNTYNYNGTVNQTYTGPNSNSGSSVMNIGNLNSTNVTATASGGSSVGVNTSTNQHSNNHQAGSATSNAATMGNGVFDAANTITTTNH